MPAATHTLRCRPILAMNRRGGSLLLLRWLIALVALVLGTVLVMRGHLLIGGLICALAALRVVSLLLFARPRRTFGGQWSPNPVRLLLRGLAHREFTVAANTIGVDSGELRRDFAGGRSIADAAAAAGIALDAVVGAVVTDATARLDQALTDGMASPDVVAQAKARLPQWAARLVHATRDDAPGATAMRRRPAGLGPRAGL